MNCRTARGPIQVHFKENRPGWKEIKTVAGRMLVLVGGARLHNMQITARCYGGLPECRGISRVLLLCRIGGL